MLYSLYECATIVTGQILARQEYGRWVNLRLLYQGNLGSNAGSGVSKLLGCNSICSPHPQAPEP